MNLEHSTECECISLESRPYSLSILMLCVKHPSQDKHNAIDYLLSILAFFCVPRIFDLNGQLIDKAKYLVKDQSLAIY